MTAPCPCPAAAEPAAGAEPQPFLHQHEELPHVQRSQEVEGEGGAGLGGVTQQRGPPNCRVPKDLGLCSTPGLAASWGSMGGRSAVGWGAEQRSGPPWTPTLLPPQLSYNMVSACNRLCRTRLLCGLRREDEELVSGTRTPPARAGWGQRSFGGPGPPHRGGAVQWMRNGGVPIAWGAPSPGGGVLSPGGSCPPGGFMSHPSDPPCVPSAAVRATRRGMGGAATP